MRRNSGMLRQSIWIDAMGFTWEKITYRGSDAAEITGYEGKLPDLKIPEEMEGLPVRSIAAHAFSGRSDIRSVVLPCPLSISSLARLIALSKATKTIMNNY